MRQPCWWRKRDALGVYRASKVTTPYYLERSVGDGNAAQERYRDTAEASQGEWPWASIEADTLGLQASVEATVLVGGTRNLLKGIGGTKCHLERRPAERRMKRMLGQHGRAAGLGVGSSI